MAKLEELEEELYGKEGDGELKKRMKKRVFFPPSLRQTPTRWIDEKKVSPGDAGFNRNARKFFVAGITILLTIGGAVFLFLYLGTQGEEAKIEIKSQDRVTAGEVVTLPLVFRNVSRAVLKEVELTVVLPPGSLIRENDSFRPAPPRLIKKYEDLSANQEGTVEVVARFFGKEGEEKKIQAVLLYRPENLRARFSAKTEKVLTINRVPLSISWEIPDTFIQGQEISVGVHYISQASASFDNLSLRLEYPAGFELVSVDPKPAVGDALWNIGTLDPGKEGVINIKGILSGVASETKTFRGGIGVFNSLTKEWLPYFESSKETKIAQTPLSIAGFVEGVRERTIVPGEQLNFSIKYKNNTNFIIKNVSVRAFIDGIILDVPTLSIDQRGVFDALTNAVVWSPASLSALKEIKPEEEGLLTFNIATRSRAPIRGVEDKNLVVRLRSTIESASPSQEFSGSKLGSEDMVAFKVRTKMVLAGRALYRSSPILNSGPLPPRVGVKTTYAVLWEVRNFTNDLKNAEVRASLPPNVKWENAVFPKETGLTFDAAAGEAHWVLGNLPAGTGVLVPALTAAFQVSLTPAETDKGKMVTLLNESRLSGKDSFTGEDVAEILGPLSTELREDPNTSSKDWSVVAQ